jgi:hypothetical protein
VLEHQLVDQYKWTHNPTHPDANDHLANAQRIWSQFVEKLELNLDRDEKLYLKIKKDMEEVFQCANHRFLIVICVSLFSSNMRRCSRENNLKILWNLAPKWTVK